MSKQKRQYRDIPRDATPGIRGCAGAGDLLPFIKLVCQATIMGKNLEIGNQAPDFETETYGAEKVRLSDFYSKGTVALYFYPKDNTTGCINEACSLRNAEEELASLGVQVLGVSTDGVKSHEKFRDKFSLNFPLLSDRSRKIVALYGVRWKFFPFVARRTTFLIEKGGRIAYIWNKVKSSSHAEEILSKVKELGL